MKIVILGAKGMLGNDLGKVFADEKSYLLDKDELDITHRDEVVAYFFRTKPDVVINAAAYTDVDGCEINKELAMKVNGEAPGYLAEASKEIGAIFAHYSTNYVFSGSKREGYKEDDTPQNPCNFYGASKLAGENAVKKVGGKYYLIRTSWLFGLRGLRVGERPRNFIETILRLAEEKDEIRVVNDQHGKPTFALDLARKTRELIEGKNDFGVYHITNEPATTWYEFAKEILEIGHPPKKARVVPCTSEEFPRPADRPRYSTLLNTKLSPLRSWKEALREYLEKRN